MHLLGDRLVVLQLLRSDHFKRCRILVKQDEPVHVTPRSNVYQSGDGKLLFGGDTQAGLPNIGVIIWIVIGVIKPVVAGYSVDSDPGRDHVKP